MQLSLWFLQKRPKMVGLKEQWCSKGGIQESGSKEKMLRGTKKGQSLGKTYYPSSQQTETLKELVFPAGPGVGPALRELSKGIQPHIGRTEWNEKGTVD